MENKPLRSGFTTGTCAAAAAKAAAALLFTGEAPERVSIRTPKGTEAVFCPERTPEPEYAGYLRVKKDAGDDPDVTDGTWVCAQVQRLLSAGWERLCAEGRGYMDEQYPGLYIDGGPGIGIVTRRGLSCPVGHYAVNPVPRKMIWEAVDEVCRAYDGGAFLRIGIAIPAGITLAEKTFNPRLGIEGGISVLGTSGVVEPMSEEALVETVRLDIRMKVQETDAPLILTPGNYGEEFLNERLQVPLGEAVKCSNFIADAAAMAVEEGAKKLLLVGHIGKLIKVAGGAKNTHSRYGDGRMEELAKLCLVCAPEAADAVRAANTTEEAMEILMGEKKAEEVLRLAAEAAQRQITDWTGGRLPVEVVTFSSAHGILGMTKHADELLSQWRARRNTDD